MTMLEGIGAALGVTLVAGVILLIINAFYRVLVNQDRIAEAKERAQMLNAEAKKAPVERQKELMVEAMSHQRQIMRMNMKPMLLSFIVVALLLPWLGSYYRDFDVSLVDASGTLALSDGTYSITSLNGNAVITNGDVRTECTMPCDVTLAGVEWNVAAAGDKIHFALVAAILPALPLVGGWQLGWFWWYILVSIPLAIIIRAAYGIRA